MPLTVPARDIEPSLLYYTGKLGGELVWKIHALNTRIAAVRLCVDFARRSSSRRHAQSDLRVERLESAVASLRVHGWTPESGPFEIPNAPSTLFAIRLEYGWPSMKTKGRK
jgi:hypothetical protein